MKFTRETARRALRTFIQAIIAYIAVNIVTIDFTAGDDVVKSALIGLGVSAVAAGLSALMNLEEIGGSSENFSDGNFDSGENSDGDGAGNPPV